LFTSLALEIHKALSIIKRLQINHLRNLQSVSIDPSAKINLFYGENGSGKTSILEAVSLLGLGRSFRSHKSRSLVNHQEAELTVFAQIQRNQLLLPVGIQKRRNGSGVIRVSGETIQSAAVLAKQLPLLLINAQSFLLIEGSPIQRRQFLDWMAFHVKPDFSQLWKDLQKVLKQRNSLLRRDKIRYSELQPWDIELVRLSLLIDIAREDVFTDFKEQFLLLEAEFDEVQLNIEIEYICGWDKEQGFQAQLQDMFERDKRDGYTHNGPQRADIKILAKQKPAVEVLSRGQEKALICAMTIAQAQVYQRRMERDCLFLIDDLLAELDGRHAQKLAAWLTKLNGQVFVTGVSRESLVSAWENEDSDIVTFHVEHGKLALDTNE
jgi:DNA replication and repair protein RecF